MQPQCWASSSNTMKEAEISPSIPAQRPQCPWSRGAGQAYRALGSRNSTTGVQHFYVIYALLGWDAGLIQALAFAGTLLCHLRCFTTAAGCRALISTGLRPSQSFRHVVLPIQQFSAYTLCHLPALTALAGRPDVKISCWRHGQCQSNKHQDAKTENGGMASQGCLTGVKGNPYSTATGARAMREQVFPETRKDRALSCK